MMAGKHTVALDSADIVKPACERFLSGRRNEMPREYIPHIMMIVSHGEQWPWSEAVFSLVELESIQVRKAFFFQGRWSLIDRIG